MALRTLTAALLSRVAPRPAVAAVVALGASGVAGAPSAFAAPKLPEIRLSSHNAVPGCVSPDRLMAFLKQRNRKLDPRFRNIASYYKQHGDAWGVRWDYAFFQMAIETNFLSYRQPNGRMGDVDPKQNNFAGIGTTGGGVPGDSFPDVSTGVLGQIQHLVVYSGEMVPDPVAARTRLKQEHILAKSHELKRPVLFSDLAGRWAVDRKYAGSIEWVAERFRAEYCKGRAMKVAEVLPWRGAGQAGSAPGRDAAPVKAVSSWEQPGSAENPGNKAKPPAPSKTKAATAPATAAAPVRQIIPGPPAAVPPPAPVAKAEDEEAAHFALFAPPAGLADATMNAAPADSHDSSPAAVSGKTVGGFMVGDAGKPAYPPPSGLGVKPGRCVVETARYGGETTVLVKAPSGGDTHYVALSVLDGFEDSMTASFLASRPEGGDVLGTFPSRDAALAKARTLCAD